MAYSASNPPAKIGQTIGGSGVLFLTASMPFSSTYIFVAATILTFVLIGVRPPTVVYSPC